MKKLGVTLGSLIITFVFAGTALAYPYAVNFDADAAGTTYSAQMIWGWDSEAIATEVIPVADNVSIFGNGTGQLIDLITHQQLDGPNVGNTPGVLDNGDLFYESITLEVINGLGPPPANSALSPGYRGHINPADNALLYVDVALGGFITNFVGNGVDTTASNPENILNNSYWGIYTAGSARMYVDTNMNLMWDAGETVVADLALSNAGPIILTPSVFQNPANFGAQISFEFETLFANTDYFSAAPGYEDFFDLITAGMLLTTTQGGVSYAGQQGGLESPDIFVPDEILLGFQETGFDLEFNAIPEPTSMLLLGTGLVGLAGVNRRRKKAKKA